MTRRLLLPALATVALAGAGCTVQNHGSVQLSALCFPPTPDATTGVCAYSSGSCDQVLADGHLSVDLVTSGGTLQYPIQVDNMRKDNSDSNGRTNTNNAFIERFDMEYEAPGLGTMSASVNQSATVLTSGSTVVVVTLVPATAGEELAKVLPADRTTEGIIKVKAHGRYGDDTEFDTAEYVVPVTASHNGQGAVTCTDTTKTLHACPQPGQTAVYSCD